MLNGSKERFQHNPTLQTPQTDLKSRHLHHLNEFEWMLMFYASSYSKDFGFFKCIQDFRALWMTREDPTMLGSPHGAREMW